MKNAENIIELQAVFKGRVQGVGFRSIVQRHALNNKVKGSIKNNEDGTVSMVAQGERQVLEKLLDEIKRDPFPASISSIDEKWGIPSLIFETFKIIS